MDAFLQGKKLTSANTKPKPVVKPEGSGKAKGPTPWVEKYRPKTVDDVAMQDEVVAVLKKSLKGADLPNLLFYGPPGTGKTSTILALARELFGDMYRARILELNASDERGIDVIREKVKNFAKQTASATRSDGSLCPSFKIVILDEADSMTSAAQAALRRVMEKEAKSTRFCLICNYVSRIIEPLTSRCSKFRFKPLSEEAIMERLKLVAVAENVEYDEGSMDAIVMTSEGDMRRAITYLQSAYRLKVGAALNRQDILDVAGVIPDSWILEYIKACQSDSLAEVQNIINKLFYEGYSGSQMLLQIHNNVLNGTLSDIQQAVIFQKIAKCDSNILDGASEYLQLMDLAFTVIKQMRK